MTLKEMRELAKQAYLKSSPKIGDADYTKIANKGSEHDPKKLQKEVEDSEKDTY